MRTHDVLQIAVPRAILFRQIDGRLHSFQDLLKYNANMRKKTKQKYAASKLGAIRYNRLEFSGRVGDPDLLPTINDNLDITAVAIAKMLHGLALDRKDTSFKTPHDLELFFAQDAAFCQARDWFELVWPACTERVIG